ncbi:MAG: hypothetical protein JF595_12730 [Sphingomonadales bacterium]|nr:hypothetical protein [Sphingomonadales bacterium]
MFGPRITTVFRSRWRAVWFVVSVLAGVYWSIPSKDAQDDPDAQKAAEAVASILQQGQPPAQPEKHTNPWAKNSAQ